MASRIINFLLMSILTVLLGLMTHWFHVNGWFSGMVFLLLPGVFTKILWDSYDLMEDFKQWRADREVKRQAALLKQFEVFYNIQQSKKG